MGASGVIIIIAPLPPAEVPDEPIILNDYTFAYMLDPYGRLYGLPIKSAIGTLQVRVFTIVRVLIPSQWIVF